MFVKNQVLKYQFKPLQTKNRVVHLINNLRKIGSEVVNTEGWLSNQVSGLYTLP